MRFIDNCLMKPFLLRLKINAAYYGLRMEKLVNVYRAMEYVDFLYQGKSPDGDLVGDFCEFGVASGNMMINAYQISRMYKNLTSMRFVGFDSFEGLPEQKSKYDLHPGWKAGDFAVTFDSVKQNLKRGGYLRISMNLYRVSLNKHLQ